MDGITSNRTTIGRAIWPHLTVFWMPDGRQAAHLSAARFCRLRGPRSARRGSKRRVEAKMCGICGWFDFTGKRPPDEALVRAMNGAIRHRGPDGEGFHFEPGLAFGHRRLAIIDLQTGDQP